MKTLRDIIIGLGGFALAISMGLLWAAGLLLFALGIPLAATAAALWLTGAAWVAAPVAIGSCILWFGTAQRIVERVAKKRNRSELAE
jgi:TRAP-type C4-dicarboxylate transport system permease small subunit